MYKPDYDFKLDLPKGEVIVLIRTERLKEIARKHKGTERDVWGGDNGKARMIKLPVEELMSPCN